MLIVLYRTPYKPKRWYLKVFFRCVDICKINAWLIYRRLLATRHSQKTTIDTSEFYNGRSRILVPTNQVNGTPCWASPKRFSTEEVRDPRGRAAVVPTPQRVISRDGVAHWPTIEDKKNTCRHCKVGVIRVMCMKCNVPLCLTKDRNSFHEFHN